MSQSSHELVKSRSLQETQFIGRLPASQRAGNWLGNESLPRKWAHYYPFLSAPQ